MALAVTTSPAHIDGASVSSTVTTAAFSPPAGSLLVACITANSSSGGTTVASVSGGGLTWTGQIIADFPGVGGSGYSAVFTAPCAAGATGITVTVTTSGSTSTTRRPSVDVYVVTGADLSNPIAGSGRSASTTNAPAFSPTNAVANGMHFVSASEWQKRGVPTGTGFTATRTFDQAGADGVSGLTGYKTGGTLGGTSAYTLDAAGTLAAAWNISRVEIRPAVAPTISAGADASVTLGAAFTRTATETSDGGQAITARSWTVVSGPAEVGSTLSTSAALSWTPTTLGTYVLQYAATNSGGTGTDTVSVTVTVAGVPILATRLTDARVAVEAAFGADLTDTDGTGWQWSEITTDVRIADGINLRHGRSDEASSASPATCTLTLDNTSGDYSLGGRSVHWPYVRQGTPVRVSVSLDDGDFAVLFQGYADGWSPGWDGTGRNATVELSASGVLRRLGQGASPVQSTMRRALGSSDAIAYWPMEDGEDAQEIATGVTGGQNMTFTGRLHPGGSVGVPAVPPDLAADSSFPCSLALPKMNGSELYGNVGDYTVTGSTQLRFLIAFPDDGATDETVLAGMVTTGTAQLWEIRNRSANVLNVRAWSSSGMVLDQDITFDQAGTQGQLGLQLVQSGGNVNWDIDYLELGSYTSGGFSGSLVGYTVGQVQRVQLNTDGGNDDVVLGHVVLRTSITSEFENAEHLNAYEGEYVTAIGGRLDRLCEENGIPIESIGSGEVLTGSEADFCGPQYPGALLELLRDAEGVDRGSLFDGIGPGLAYTTRRFRESRSVLLTLDAAAGEVGVPFLAVHDDQNRRNRVTVKRPQGSEASYEDVDGSLGIETIGLYDESVEVAAAEDGALLQYAGWLVHQGTVEGYRWPSLVIDLAAAPHLATGWLDVLPGKRIDVVNVQEVAPSAPDETVSLTVEGYQQTITPFAWVAEVNCSPGQGWSVARVADEDADTAEFLMRTDSDGCTVASSAAQGATSLAVTTPSGPIWTTDADDYPLTLSVGGVQVTATACSGAGAAQTFTVDPLPIARSAGLPVSVWQPPALGL